MNSAHRRTIATRPRPTLDHSGVGIAAFVIALVAMLLAMLAVPFGFFLQILPRIFGLTTSGDEHAAGAIVVLVALNVAAAGLAFAALRQEGHSRVFPMIALVVAGLTLLTMGIIVAFAALVLRA